MILGMWILVKKISDGYGSGYAITKGRYFSVNYPRSSKRIIRHKICTTPKCACYMILYSRGRGQLIGEVAEGDESSPSTQLCMLRPLDVSCYY
jgi:hypothetical protein